MARRHYELTDKAAVSGKPVQTSLSCSTYSPADSPGTVTDLVSAAATAGSVKIALSKDPCQKPDLPDSGVKTGSLLADMSNVADMGAGAELVTSTVNSWSAGAR